MIVDPVAVIECVLRYALYAGAMVMVIGSVLVNEPKFRLASAALALASVATARLIASRR